MFRFPLKLSRPTTHDKMFTVDVRMHHVVVHRFLAVRATVDERLSGVPETDPAGSGNGSELSLWRWHWVRRECPSRNPKPASRRQCHGSR
jgi:hypothetical protein